MKIKCLFFCTLLISTLFANPIVLQTDRGRAEYAWLKLPKDVRSLSMSGLDQPLWHSDTNLTLNLERRLLPVSGGDHIDRFEFAVPFWGGVYSLDGLLEGGEELQGYDDYGKETASFSSSFWGLGLTAQYAYSDYDFFVRAHYLYSEIESYSSQAALFDLGVQYFFKGMLLNLSALNIGYGGSYIEREIVVPFGMRSSVTYEISLAPWWSFSPFVGVRYQNDEPLYYPLGLEVDVAKILQWRISWAAAKESFELGTGFGLKLPWVQLDYGFSTHEYLGGTHSVGFKLFF